MTSAIDRLRAVDSCAVSDALDRLGLDDTTVSGVANLAGNQRIAGSVTTVRLGPVLAATAPRHLCTAAIEGSGAHDVIVIDHQHRSDCAGWGGNLSRAARRRGVAGTLVFGAARDLDEARELGYPVFATSATPRTARGRTSEHAWNEPITFAGVDVHPGDYVIADASGIVFVPASEITAVLDTAEQIAAAEASIAAAIDAGEPVSSAMSSDYERMTERVATPDDTAHDGGPPHD